MVSEAPSLRKIGAPRVVRDPAADAALAGLDALDLPVEAPRPVAGRAWSATWPKLGALAIFFLIWQIVVWTGWKGQDLLPAPSTALSTLWDRAGTGEFWQGVGRTMQRAAVGYGLALLVGGAIGLAVARIRLLRTAVGSFITALQTMPSVVWFPLALLLFQVSETAILFVVVLGAAPSIANGVISGIDYVPPLLVKAGRSLGARGFALYRHVIVPAAFPSVLAGLRQGWAFAWRSLMAGELITIVPGHPSIGSDLDNARQTFDSAGLVASMITIFIVGVLVDSAFESVDRRLRRRRGVLENAS